MWRRCDDGLVVVGEFEMDNSNSDGREKQSSKQAKARERFRSAGCSLLPRTDRGECPHFFGGQPLPFRCSLMAHPAGHWAIGGIEFAMMHGDLPGRRS